MSTPTQERNLQELIIALQGIQEGKEPLLSPSLMVLLREGLHHSLLPDSLKPSAAEAMQLTFEATGGLPRAVLWADRNYSAFMKIYARQTAQTIEPVVPPPRTTTAHNEWPEWMDAQRLSYRSTTPTPTHDPTDDDD